MPLAVLPSTQPLRLQQVSCDVHCQQNHTVFLAQLFLLAAKRVYGTVPSVWRSALLVLSQALVFGDDEFNVVKS
jgi:hypothetical protein